MPEKKDESLEQGLSHSATKKGLTGPAKREYIGGAITNMRKDGRLPAVHGKQKRELEAGIENNRYWEKYHRDPRRGINSVAESHRKEREAREHELAKRNGAGWLLKTTHEFRGEMIHKEFHYATKKEAEDAKKEKKRYLTYKSMTITRVGAPAAPKAAPARPTAEPNYKEAYLERKRKERAEQDKKDYERIMEKREPAWALSGHDKAVIKREGARRDKEYKAKQAELERARKEQKKQAQEEKHTALYSAGKKPMYVVYAAKSQGEKAQPVAEFKTQASASNHAYKLRQKGYYHTEYKNEYKAEEKSKEEATYKLVTMRRANGKMYTQEYKYATLAEAKAQKKLLAQSGNWYKLEIERWTKAGRKVMEG